MAVLFKDIIQKQQEYLEAEERKKATESISSAELKQLMTQAVAMGGDVNENIIMLYDEMRKQTALLQKEQKDTLAVSEEKQEAAKVEQDQTDLLEKIADNTKAKPEKDSKELGLGTIVASITAALAGLAGVVAGYVKSIKILLDVFTPEFIKTKLAKTLTSFENVLVEFGVKLKTIFTKGVDKISAFFGEGLNKLKTILAFDEASNIGKFITSIKEGFSKLLAPFTEAFSTIKNLMSGASKGLEFVGGVAKSISSTITSIGKTLGGVDGLFKGVFSVVSKLATPLFVIMTLWDTVSNVIDRFESDGVIGAFAGIFEGLFKSIVAAPLDLLKSIVSWVLGKFGFNEAEQFLDSFSFVDIVKGFFDVILNPIDTIVNMFEGVADLVDEYIVQPLANAFAPITDFFVGIKDSIVGFFEAIEIPKIGFTIPIIDKEVSIGPFYPFKREKPGEATVTGGETKTVQQETKEITETTKQTEVIQKGTREEYDAVYKENLIKTNGNERVAQKLTTAQVGLAPGSSPETLPSTTNVGVVGVPTQASKEEYNTLYKENLKKTNGNEQAAKKLTDHQIGLTSEASAATTIAGGGVPAQASKEGVAVQTPVGVIGVKATGISQDMKVSSETLVPDGAAIPQATGPETREQTEARIKGALKAGVEERQAEVRAIERGEKVTPLEKAEFISQPTINGEVAPTSRQEYYKQQGFTPDQIANLNARQAKIDTLRSQDVNSNIDKDLAIIDSEAVALSKQADSIAKVSPDEVKREAQAYSSQLNVSGMLVTPQPVVGAAAAPTSSAANMIYGASAENATAAAASQQTGSTNNTVVAPTTVNNNTVNSYKPDVRNQDSSFKRMLDARYVAV